MPAGLISPKQWPYRFVLCSTQRRHTRNHKAVQDYHTWLYSYMWRDVELTFANGAQV